ncbi:kinase-like domain-containing protein [Coniochaeta sp. 2T2.1]|nr:kinase-like domain-containing protein [Coniochaeta sp. 2T2.1]
MDHLSAWRKSTTTKAAATTPSTSVMCSTNATESSTSSGAEGMPTSGSAGIPLRRLLLSSLLRKSSRPKAPRTTLFCLPLDRFDIKGPNGIHLVFVYPVLGPRVSRLFHLVNDSGDPSGPLRTFCRQTTQAMAVLHSLGICHGDFRPANILARISGLDGMSEDEVMEILGKPRMSEVVTVSGDAHHLDTAPRYVVYPIDWDKVISNPKGASLVDEKACVIDFGESFEVSAPTPDLGIPQVYCSPEYTLEGAVGIGCDIWALGCTLFEIRTGRKLFDTFDDDKDEYLRKIAMILGKLPEPWWSDTWEARRQYLQDETDMSGRVVEVSRDNSAMAADQAEGERHVVVYERPEPRSLHKALREGLYYENWNWLGGIERDISEKEIGLFADLLAKLLRYSPGDRLSAAEALEHDWFRHGGFGDD